MSCQMEESELMKDSKYRVYVSQVEKALKNFEYTSEWPDLIAALGKLNKVLLSYTKYPVIPRRIKLSKRLSQCMHPALPAGVHLKALETYDIIFKCMGTNRLAQELFIYSAGLFPLLGIAATPVRPALLAIYEAHFVPLGERLRPALPGFLAGVLLGLEPGSDHYDSTNSLLEHVSSSVGPQEFYASLWRCIRIDSPARAPGVAFALAHINKRNNQFSPQDALIASHLQGNNADLMINALEAAVQDTSVLVQRSALDLLLIALPFHSVPPPPAKLLSAALYTILRRDMSLNRRLYSWLLGSEVNLSSYPPDHPLVVKMKSEASENKPNVVVYYRLFSHDILLEALRSLLLQSSRMNPVNVKPYKLLTSLLDKPEIAPEILDVILYEVFRTIYLTCYNQLSNDSIEMNVVVNKSMQRKKLLATKCQEVIKHANLLFNTLEPQYIWQYVGDLYEQAIGKNPDKCYEVCEAGKGLPSVLELCLLTDFLLDVIPTETYLDNSSEILPNLFIRIITLSTKHLSKFSPVEICATLKLCTNILTKIQPISIKTVNRNDMIENGSVLDQTEHCTIKIDGEKSKSTIDLSETVKQAIDTDPSSNIMEQADTLKTGLTGLEKSKSDSKLNENGLNNLIPEDNSRERSNSNQMLRRFQIRSPKSEKKSKNKKSKSNPKLFESKVKDSTEQHHTSENSQFSDRLTTKIFTAEIENKLIVKCLEIYKEFYVKFIKCKVFHNVMLENLYDIFLIRKNIEEQSYRNLEILLNNCLSGKEESVKMLHDVNVIELKHALKIEYSLKEHSDALQVASIMFLEFMAFPNILGNDSVDPSDIPAWLKYLAITSCLGCENSTEAQLVCTSTFLEVINLSKSLKQIKSSDKNTLVLMGILRNEYVSFIENCTSIIEVMAQTLWDFLGVLTSQSQIITCVTLLYQIHNTFDSHGYAECVIARYLAGNNCGLDHFKRFSLLWHVGRDLDTKVALNQRSVKQFDRCLLKLLDNLQNSENISLKLYSEDFLLHCLLRNDVSRLISPLLYILLSPNTARISVLHANIEKSDASQAQNEQKVDDPSLKKIYAISSVDGHVMYHVADDNNKARKMSFSFVKRSSNEIINIATSLVDDKNIVTQKNRDFKVEQSSFNNSNDKVNKSNVKVFVNPLSFKDSSSEKSSIESLSTSDSISESTTTQDQESSSLSMKNFIFLSSASERDSGILNECELLIHTSADDFELTNELPENYSHVNNIDDKKSEDSTITNSKGINFSPAKKISSYLERIESISDGTHVEHHEKTLMKSHSLDESIKNNENTAFENTGMVHSWSFEGNNPHHSEAELELSTPAEDFFNNGSQNIIEEIVRDIVEEICKQDETGKINRTKNRSAGKGILKNKGLNRSLSNGPVNVGPAHSHLLLYCDVYDSSLILYALRTLKNTVNANSRMLISCLATTALQTNSEILNLLARHRKSVFGYGFHGEITNSEYINCYRGNMYLEVLISICLNYSRSFYPNLSNKKLTDFEIINNLKIQLECLDLLNTIVKELVIIVKDSAKGFACYIADMLLKCKLQKVILHSLVSAVKTCEADKRSFTEEILIFNNFNFKKYDGKISEYVESFQVQLLRLVQSLIALEYHVGIRGDCPPKASIPQQATFRAAILTALETPALRPLHHSWAGTVVASLPYLGASLTQIVLSVIHQLCYNIEIISKCYKADTISISNSEMFSSWSFVSDSISFYSLKSLDLTPVDTIENMTQKFEKKLTKSNSNSHKCNLYHQNSNESKRTCNANNSKSDIIPDYAITQLECLTHLCHYCLLDNAQQLSVLTQPSITNSLPSVLSHPGQIINNLLHVFLPNPLMEEINTKSNQENEYYNEARKAVLSHMPKIISSVAVLWQFVSVNDNQDVLGSRRVLRQQLLSFLSPISVHHSSHFLAAIGVAWNDRKQDNTANKKVLTQPSPGQLSIVNLISAIRVIPIDNLVQTIHTVIKNPPNAEGLKSDFSLDVSVLELFYCYIQTVANVQLLESWSSLLNLIKDGPTFSPPAQFLMLAILNEFVQKCSPLNEKKDQKDLQDVTIKMIESISQISGSCLEQTTWLRRNLAVKEGDLGSSGNLTTSETTAGQGYSVQAQLMLADILAPLLDVCFGSQEKDKVVSVVSALMCNVVPYLRKHSARNAGSWAACSKLLASLSGYPATRRAWRRDALELLLDPALFKMPAECLQQWRYIVDHLMTHDNTTFRELMSRVNVGQSGGLNLFSSKEQEAEQRAMLLKRLAFVVLCGDIDQYAKHMPEIQEQLAGGLRMGAPIVGASVFLCCRALLLRVTPLNVTSLWPLILCECLQLFLKIEYQLSSNSEQSSVSSLNLDSNWAGSFDVLSGDGLKLTLAAAQLLDLALVLPAQHLPHFQMYRWAFVNENPSEVSDANTIFEPHINRISRLMDARFGETNPRERHSSGLLLPGCATEGMQCLDDLHMFFTALATNEYHQMASHSDLLTAVEIDFLEKMPA